MKIGEKHQKEAGDYTGCGVWYSVLLSNAVFMADSGFRRLQLLTKCL